MALVNVTHKPVTAQARQFDGSLDAMVDIVTARAAEGVSVAFTLAGDGSLATLNVSGGTVGTVTLNAGDWVVFPSDPEQPAFSVEGAKAGDDWQIV